MSRSATGSAYGETMLRLGPYSFSNQDIAGTMRHLGDLWSSLMEGRSSAAADELGRALAARGAAALGLPDGTPLTVVGMAAARLPAGAPPLEPLLADAWHTLRAASETLRAEGQLPTRQVGVVTQLSRCAGGVPKLPVDAVEVDHRGVVGDTQHARVHHGRPWQALCLFADEVIEQFRSEGHPIGRGSTGENITVSGIDWAAMRPGVRLRIGTVLAHVQAYTEPCRKNAQWFLGGDFNRMNIARGPVSRVYATVLEPGRIVTGDAIELEPSVS